MSLFKENPRKIKEEFSDKISSQILIELAYYFNTFYFLFSWKNQLAAGIFNKDPLNEIVNSKALHRSIFILKYLKINHKKVYAN